ncbi:hypothetical protein [Bradyrhizobium sp. AUGA SZCCT0240]|uniref:hypothetical protein n=1 Tax=Bradyrhizobium sp. AUGA SZCCT0240 TaxID=2807669 RepID=UPI0020122215|nr:hypothetical protein [Bradyrhizobium sp. AUGA SZCCT0240]
MIWMLVVGYVFAIRPEGLICCEVNWAYRWYGKLGIEDAITDHSALSRARNERFRGGDFSPRLFERVVEAGIAAGLAGGEGFAVDTSLIQADANKQRSIAGQDGAGLDVERYLARWVFWTAPGFEYLAVEFAGAIQKRLALVHGATRVEPSPGCAMVNVARPSYRKSLREKVPSSRFDLPTTEICSEMPLSSTSPVQHRSCPVSGIPQAAPA